MTTKTVIKQKLIAFSKTAIFTIITYILVIIAASGITSIIHSANIKDYKEEGKIIVIEESGNENFKYTVLIKTGTNNIYSLFTNAEFTKGESYIITFDSNKTATPTDDKIIEMTKKF